MRIVAYGWSRHPGKGANTSSINQPIETIICGITTERRLHNGGAVNSSFAF